MPGIGASDLLSTAGLIAVIWVTTLGGALLFLSLQSRRGGAGSRRPGE